jgi:hypothetical protein
MQESTNRRPPVVSESVWSALVHVYDTGQRLVVERIELAKLELIAFARGELVIIARHLARNLVLALTGAIFLIAGWFVLSWGLVNIAAAALSVPWRLVIDAGLNLAIGAGLVWLAQRPSTQAAERKDP